MHFKFSRSGRDVILSLRASLTRFLETVAIRDKMQRFHPCEDMAGHFDKVDLNLKSLMFDEIKSFYGCLQRIIFY